MLTIEKTDAGFVINPNNSDYPATYILAGNPQGEELENHGGDFATFDSQEQAQKWIDDQE